MNAVEHAAQIVNDAHRQAFPVPHLSELAVLLATEGRWDECDALVSTSRGWRVGVVIGHPPWAGVGFRVDLLRLADDEIGDTWVDGFLLRHRGQDVMLYDCQTTLCNAETFYFDCPIWLR